MNKKGSIALALLMGASLIMGRYHKQVKKGLKQVPKKLQHRVNVDTYYHGNAFSRLSKPNRAKVINALHNIIPKQDSPEIRSFKYQLDVVRYMRILNYLRHRYEFHYTHASIVLNIPMYRAKKIAETLKAEKLIKISYVSPKVNDLDEVLPKYQSAFIDRKRVENTLNSLKVHYKSGVNVQPLIFTKALRNSIAENMFN